MRKVILLLFGLFYSFMIFSNEEDTLSEDEEIAKLKKQIEGLQSRINYLEKRKERKKITNKKNNKIGLVLSGGGAKGLAHIGVLKVLDNMNIKPDYIAGTSMGAIIGALYSAGYSPNEIEQLIVNNNWENIINGELSEKKIPLEKKIDNKEYMVSLRYDNKLKISLPKGLSNNHTIYLILKNLLQNVEGIENFDELPIPLRVIATDLNTGKPVALKSGDLARAITASAAIPTIFEPVEIGKDTYVDGLITRNFPVIDSYNMGANIVIGSNVGNEVQDKEDYNIITVLTQLMAIQSASTTEEQKKLVTVLINPDVLSYSPTDLRKWKELIELGEKATLEKSKELSKYSKEVSEKSLKKRKIKKRENVFIENIVYKCKIDKKDKDIIESELKDVIGKRVSFKVFEENMLKLYGNDIIDQLYYTINGNTLTLDVTVNPRNTIGLGVNYLTGYGTTFNIGTTILSLGKIGSRTTLNFQAGDYLGAGIKNFTYYGNSNKLGIITSLEYSENPFYLYNGNKKISDSYVRSLNLEGGILTQYENSIVASYGLTLNYSDLIQNTGEISQQDIEYSNNYNGAFIKFSFDNLDSNRHPKNGIKMDFEYTWEGTFKKSSSQFYGPLYSLDGYFPLTKKYTFLYGMYGGTIAGDNISLDKYITLGGTKNNLKNRAFGFYGYRYQQKLVENVLIFKLGLEYEIQKNWYASFRWNIGTYEELNAKLIHNGKKMWQDYSQGFDVALTYETPFGPLEFSVARDNYRGDILTQISVGYIFK